METARLRKTLVPANEPTRSPNSEHNYETTLLALRAFPGINYDLASSSDSFALYALYRHWLQYLFITPYLIFMEQREGKTVYFDNRSFKILLDSPFAVVLVNNQMSILCHAHMKTFTNTSTLIRPSL